MARIHSSFPATGLVSDYIVYTRKDYEGTFLRRVGRVARERILHAPGFANTRRAYTEGGGRSTAAKVLRRILHPLEPVRDHNWHAALTGALTAVQYGDTVSAWGERNILFSHHGALLSGTTLSRRSPLEALVRTPVVHVLNKPALSAYVDLPALLPGINFFPSGRQPWFRVVCVLGAAPDHFFTAYGYAPKEDYGSIYPAVVYGDWHPVKGSAPATTVDLTLPQPPPNNAFALVLAVGVVMGVVNREGKVEATGYAGSGKLVKVR